MKKQSIAIIAVVAFVLAVAVGYALFSETITINGTATAKGNFDVEILSAEVTTEKGSTGAAANVAADKNSVNLTAPNLQYPGAYVEYTVTVKNAGTIDAVLKSVSETAANAKAPVVVSYTDLPTATETLASGGTDTFKIKVEWNPANDSDEEAGGTIDNNVNVSTGYTVTFNYEQITVQ